MKISDGEKLILLLLCEMYEHLGIRGEYDVRFVKSAILNKQTWGIPWHLSGVPWDSRDVPPEVREVADLLEMLSCIERSFAALSQEDRDHLKATVPLAEGSQIFAGFDGNNESEHLAVAQFLIHELGRFQRFKERELNSHMPMLATYRRMYAAFELIRHALVDDLTKGQLVELLGEGDDGR
jgi:hypothetical protein